MFNSEIRILTTHDEFGKRFDSLLNWIRGIIRIFQFTYRWRSSVYFLTIFILGGPDLNVRPFYILPHRASFIKFSRRFDVSLKAAFSNCRTREFLCGQNSENDSKEARRRKKSSQSFAELDMLSSRRGFMVGEN